MKFKGTCPRCSGQLVQEDKDEETYCFNCAYRVPDEQELIWDEEFNRYRLMTTTERLRILSPKRIPHKGYQQKRRVSSR